MKSGLVNRAFRRSVERQTKGLTDSRLTHRALVEHFGEFDYRHDKGDREVAGKANKVASNLRQSLGIDSVDAGQFTLLPHWTIASPVDYRAVVMRADFDRHGVERSQKVWSRKLGCERHNIKATAERAGILLKQRLPIDVIVDTKKEVFQAQKGNPGSAIIQVLRDGQRLRFDAAMKIQDGDCITLARVCEHVLVDDAALI